MTTTQRKMLFILIVGIAAEICTLALWKYYDERVCVISTFAFSILTLSRFKGVIFGPNIPQRNTLIVFLILLIAPIGLLVKEYIVFFTTPSEFSIEFSGRHLTMFDFDSPTTYAEIAALYIPLGATFTSLISFYYESLIPYSPDEPTMACPRCGKAFSKQESFCPYCYTLSPEVKKSIESFPNKKFLDFVADPKGKHLHCPHCNNTLTLLSLNFPFNHRGYYQSRSTGWHPGTPIQFCDSCNHFLLSPNYREWYFLPKFDRILMLLHLFLFDYVYLKAPSRFNFNRTQLVLIDNSFVLICIIYIGSAAFEYLCMSIAAVGFPLSIVLGIIWTQIRAQNFIEASKLRVQNNPDYPKILKHMGYEDSLNRKLP